MIQRKIECEKLATGYEFAPTSFRLDSKVVMAYLKAVDDRSRIYEENRIVPPMAIAALSMAAMLAGLALPPGAIHVSQELEFIHVVNVDETLTSYAKVNRRVERGKFHMLTVGIKVENQKRATVITGETSFILPLS